MDLGIAKGPWGEKRFIEGVGVGLVGRAISIIEAISKASAHDYERREDELHRDLCVFLALAHEVPPIDVNLEIDGHSTRRALLLLEILNIPRAGPGIELAAGADMSDGFLDVIAVSAAEREKLKSNLLKHLGGPITEPLLTATRVRILRLATAHCDLRLDDQVLLECTDDSSSPRPSVTVEITVDAGAVELLLPGP